MYYWYVNIIVVDILILLSLSSCEDVAMQEN